MSNSICNEEVSLEININLPSTPSNTQQYLGVVLNAMPRGQAEQSETLSQTLPAKVSNSEQRYLNLSGEYKRAYLAELSYRQILEKENSILRGEMRNLQRLFDSTNNILTSTHGVLQAVLQKVRSNNVETPVVENATQSTPQDWQIRPVEILPVYDYLQTTSVSHDSPHQPFLRPVEYSGRSPVDLTNSRERENLSPVHGLEDAFSDISSTCSVCGNPEALALDIDDLFKESTGGNKRKAIEDGNEGSGKRRAL